MLAHLIHKAIGLMDEDSKDLLEELRGRAANYLCRKTNYYARHGTILVRIPPLTWIKLGRLIG
jgi:hypothetical protein